MARKKHPTYDSRETKTILGLLSIIISLVFALSFFTVGSEGFSVLRSLFGQSTLFTSFFFLSLGLHFLGSKLAFTTTRSLIGQFILVFLIPAFITGIPTGASEISRYQLDPNKVMGGQIGYFIIKDVLLETIPTQPATNLILFLLIAIFLPLAFSVPLSSIVDGVLLVYNFFAGFFKRNAQDSKQSKSKLGKEVLPEKAATFGDFNKIIKEKKLEVNKPVEDKRLMHKDLNPDKSSFTKPLVQGGQRAGQSADGEQLEFGEEKMDRKTLTQESLNYSRWNNPPLSILLPYKKSTGKEPAIEQNARIIEQTLASFGIEAKVEEFYVGPSVVQYALNIPLGIKVEKVSGLSANIALALGVDSKAVRIDTIPETTYLGIEIPRTNREMVRFKELMESSEMRSNTMTLGVPIGKDIDGSFVVADIQKMPHLLIAGATGSGKSVLTNSFISSLLMQRTPDELRLILVDPKQVEFSDYNGIPHLLTPVITNMNEVVEWLKYAVYVMENRYSILAKEQVRNIQGYNEKKGFAAMPYIVIVIDEMADMMMTANRVETETQIVRLAQKARAVGIHLILATQRPSVNVITGIIKANIPGRVGMSVTSSTDSRVILDRIGAESLMGRGDLLYKAPDKTKSLRLQGGNIEQSEVSEMVDSIKSQAPEVGYLTLDDVRGFFGSSLEGGAGSMRVSGATAQGSLFEQAVRIAVQFNKGSSSFLQRKLNIGFNKAAELVEELEMAGVVGPQNGSKPREVLIGNADEFLANYRNASNT
jgi:S-DNA-T family DNA segregation ATPase FtsK/SpoIIIE